MTVTPASADGAVPRAPESVVLIRITEPNSFAFGFVAVVGARPVRFETAIVLADPPTTIEYEV